MAISGWFMTQASKVKPQWRNSPPLNYPYCRAPSRCENLLGARLFVVGLVGNGTDLY